MDKFATMGVVVGLRASARVLGIAPPIQCSDRAIDSSTLDELERNVERIGNEIVQELTPAQRAQVKSLEKNGHSRASAILAVATAALHSPPDGVLPAVPIAAGRAPTPKRAATRAPSSRAPSAPKPRAKASAPRMSTFNLAKRIQTERGCSLSQAMVIADDIARRARKGA